MGAIRFCSTYGPCSSQLKVETQVDRRRYLVCLPSSASALRMRVDVSCCIASTTSDYCAQLWQTHYRKDVIVTERARKRIIGLLSGMEG